MHFTEGILEAGSWGWVAQLRHHQENENKETRHFPFKRWTKIRNQE